MNAKENFLRAAEMTGPEWIPCSVRISPPLWHTYRERVEEIVLRHSSIFGKCRRGTVDFDDFGICQKGNTIVDGWGCTWRFLVDGLQGQVVEHPLSDLAVLESYEPPDPIALNIHPAEGGPPSANSFDHARRSVEEAKEMGQLAAAFCPHGFMFQRLYYLRGFENLMRDFVTEPPELNRLISTVLEYNMKLIRRWLDIGIDVLFIADDLGTQHGPPISPRTFRKHLIPAYTKMCSTARAKNVPVRLHSDGQIIEIAEDLVKAGVTILNVQDLVNGIGNIEKRLKGKVCLDLDIDRQKIGPFGKPQDVRKHVKNVVSRLNSPDGGLMINVGIYPPTPLENIQALCETLGDIGGGMKFSGPTSPYTLDH